MGWAHCGLLARGTGVQKCPDSSSPSPLIGGMADPVPSSSPRGVRGGGLGGEALGGVRFLVDFPVAFFFLLPSPLTTPILVLLSLSLCLPMPLSLGFSLFFCLSPPLCVFVIPYISSHVSLPMCFAPFSPPLCLSSLCFPSDSGLTRLTVLLHPFVSPSDS